MSIIKTTFRKDKDGTLHGRVALDVYFGIHPDERDRYAQFYVDALAKVAEKEFREGYIQLIKKIEEKTK